jgi:hypothetical protein
MCSASSLHREEAKIRLLFRPLLGPGRCRGPDRGFWFLGCLSLWFPLFSSFLGERVLSLSFPLGGDIGFGFSSLLRGEGV